MSNKLVFLNSKPWTHSEVQTGDAIGINTRVTIIDLCFSLKCKISTCVYCIEFNTIGSHFFTEEFEYFQYMDTTFASCRFSAVLFHVFVLSPITWHFSFLSFASFHFLFKAFVIRIKKLQNYISREVTCIWALIW